MSSTSTSSTVLLLLLGMPIGLDGFTQPMPNSLRISMRSVEESSKQQHQRRRTLHHAFVDHDDILVEVPSSSGNRMDEVSNEMNADDSSIISSSLSSSMPLYSQNATDSYLSNDITRDDAQVSSSERNDKLLDDEIVLDAISKSSPTEQMTVAGQDLRKSKSEVENVKALLAVSQQAVAELENDLTSNIPLIPLSAENDTVATSSTLVATPTAPASPLEDVVPVIEEKPVEIAAKPVIQERQVGEERIEPASMSKIIKFAIPAIGVWLCSPLLSLIDTSAVGLLSGTAQQAALNPAVVITDYAALLIAFLYTGATNLVASAQEKDRGVAGSPKTASSLTTALQLSTFVGAGLGTLLIVFSRQLLRALIGNDAISPEVFTAAMKYVCIRGLGMPAAAIIGSAQAGCLGMQDIKSPLYVLLAAAIINFFGDVLFVRSSNPFIGGAAGAAWATVFSQYAAVAFFVRWLTTKPKSKQENTDERMNLTNAIMELTGESASKEKSFRKQFKSAIKNVIKDVKQKKKPEVKSSSKRNNSRSSSKVKEIPRTRGFLHGRFRARDLLRFPDRKRAREYVPYVAPVTATQFGRVSSYIAMSHVVASALGTASMAAQQVIVSVFYCLTPISDSISLTAQSFVPLIFEKKKSKQRAKALGKTLTNFFKVGWIFSAAMVGAVLCLPFLSKLFTSDPSVMGLVNSVSPLLVGVFSVDGVLIAAEGMLLGQRDLSFLGKMYGVFFFTVPFFMFRLKSAALSGARNIKLASVWRVFFIYQVVRAAAWVARAYQIQKKTEAAEL